MSPGLPTRLRTTWVFVGALLALCGALGVLQYRSIGAVSEAERERLRSNLETSLHRLGREFNNELASAAAALTRLPVPERDEAEQRYAAVFDQWRQSNRHSGLITRFAIAFPRGNTVDLREYRGKFSDAEWPADWLPLKARMEARLAGTWTGRPGPPPPGQGPVFEVPRFVRGRGPAGEAHWLVFELNVAYAKATLLPELLRRYVDHDYQVSVAPRGDPRAVIYTSDPGKPIERPDASAGLFDLDFGRLMGGGGGRGGPGRGGPPRGPDAGRWEIAARHRSGSLEAVVARARTNSLAVTGGVLALLLITVGALVRLTRRSQRLAELQMDFVAGVSHELRTPLTVIRTAAYNLRGKMSRNPEQVERYGALIQSESERLTELVEQVLHFASARSGRLIRSRAPVSVEGVVEECLEANRALIDGSRCQVEKNVETGLPLVLGDAMALKRAVQNLITNAIKYGAEGGNWIGVSVKTAEETGGPWVEIRVADRGPGIPAEEQGSIFDPFYRGKRAVEDQIHGTGLGLSLVQGIAEAHGGKVTVRSEPMKGAEFVLRIPIAPPEFQDEFTHSFGRG